MPCHYILYWLRNKKRNENWSNESTINNLVFWQRALKFWYKCYKVKYWMMKCSIILLLFKIKMVLNIRVKWTGSLLSCLYMKYICECGSDLCEVFRLTILGIFKLGLFFRIISRWVILRIIHKLNLFFLTLQNYISQRFFFWI